MKKIIFLVLIILGIGGVIFYFSFPREKKSTSPELVLYCGAGIRNAAKAVIKAFEEKYEVKIKPTYAGSGQLLSQISSLQTGDLFMPGAELYVDLAIEKNLAFKETKKILAYFVPVIFVQVGNPKNIRSLRDLIKPGIRIGVGDERSCAIGKKTLKILKKNKIPLAAIKKNVVYKSATVNELGLAIGLKNIDAAIVWDANARHFAEQGEIIPIPPAENIPSKIPVVVLKSSSFPKLAKKFVEFASSEEGKKIWQKCKYTTSLTQ